MKLLSEINEAVETLALTTSNVQMLMDVTGLKAESINEAVTQFLTNFATKIEKGEFQPTKEKPAEEWQKERENVISIFAAIHALTDLPTALSYQPDTKNPDVGTDIDQNAVPMGSVLNNFYGKNGKEAHKIAKHRLVEIGNTVSPTLRARAQQAVDDPTRIREYAKKLQVNIEPVMNKLMSQENQESSMRMQKQAAQSNQDNMAKPMQGMIQRRPAQKA